MENKVNDLLSKDWIKFTKTWFVHRPKRRGLNGILHPAKYPESLVSEFIQFFTKERAWVLDPFLGTGSTLLAAKACNRNAVGVELSQKYFDIAEGRLKESQLDLIEADSEQVALKGDSSDLSSLLESNGMSHRQFDFCITSPPYWNQLKRNQIRQKERAQNGWDTHYSDDPKDIGNVDDYDEFLERQAHIFDLVYEVLKDKAYLVVITNNVFSEGRLFPLAYDTAIGLSRRGENSWVLKDEKIWCQDDKALLPLGVYNAWVGNRCHQYCLVFRKEVL